MIYMYYKITIFQTRIVLGLSGTSGLPCFVKSVGVTDGGF